jgi:hypothetical protein
MAGCGRIGFDPIPLGPFGAPVQVAELSDPADDDDPAISSDGLELFWSSSRTGNERLHTSSRPSRSAPWSRPTLLVEFEDLTAKGASLSRDALSLYFEAMADVQVSTRVDRESPWSVPVRVDELASSLQDGTPGLFDGERQIIFRRRDAGPADLFRATRESVTAPFSVPEAVSELNTEFDESGPFVTANGDRIYFDSSRTGSSEMYVATLDAATGTFTSITALDELNADGPASDASLTDDERVVMFASRRSGNAELYEATR